MNSKSRPVFAPRYSLRALLLAMLLFGPLAAVGWKEWQRWREGQILRAALKLKQEREDAARAVAELTGMVYTGSPSHFLKDKVVDDSESLPDSDPELCPPTPCGNNQ